jgi:transposase
MVRLRQSHPPTIDYVARRTAEGKTTKEIIRCLKRYVVREVFRALIEAHARGSSARDARDDAWRKAREAA